MSAKLTISIPEWLDRICAYPVMLYRKHKYGYSFRRIYLGEKEWTLLDEDDFYRYGYLKLSLGGFKKNFYAVSGIKNKDGDFELVRLHRLLMNSPKGRVVDHRNGDGLDNRRDNLRIATKGENVCNKIARITFYRLVHNTGEKIKPSPLWPENSLSTFGKWPATINLITAMFVPIRKIIAFER